MSAETSSTRLLRTAVRAGWAVSMPYDRRHTAVLSRGDHRITLQWTPAGAVARATREVFLPWLELHGWGSWRTANRVRFADSGKAATVAEWLATEVPTPPTPPRLRRTLVA